MPPLKPNPQLPLFDMLEGHYEVVVTNLRLKADNVWRLYNQGAVVEQVIDEIKNDFAATGIRTNNFWANNVYHHSGENNVITGSVSAGICEGQGS